MLLRLPHVQAATDCERDTGRDTRVGECKLGRDHCGDSPRPALGLVLPLLGAALDVSKEEGRRPGRGGPAQLDSFSGILSG